MKPLIDADVLRYEVGSVGEYTDETGERRYRDFDWVSETLDGKIRDICQAVEATEPPTLFITGSPDILGENYKPNFREARALSKPYKGNRQNPKPFHFKNLTHYISYRYDTNIANGYEADDLISSVQFSRLDKRDTIICTRDKDLRQCPGWHYGWECGRQPEFGPVEYDDFGTLTLVKGASGNKLVGGGKKFFFGQLLTGDIVDNIGGLNQTGPVKAYNALAEANTEEDCRTIIRDMYKSAYPDKWLQLLQEQSDLLWIVKEFDKKGNPIHYEWT